MRGDLSLFIISYQSQAIITLCVAGRLEFIVAFTVAAQVHLAVDGGALPFSETCCKPDFAL